MLRLLGFIGGITCGAIIGNGAPIIVRVISWGIAFGVLGAFIGGVIGLDFAETMEDFRDRLCQWGVLAQITDRGSNRSGIPTPLWAFAVILRLAKNERFNGEIHVTGGPIERISHLEFLKGDSENFTVESRICYWIPDPRVGQDVADVRMQTKRVRKFPVTGKVMDAHWIGDDLALGILGRLSNDACLKQPIMESRDV